MKNKLLIVLIFAVEMLSIARLPIVAQDKKEQKYNLQSQFKNPLEETKPWSYWYWVNGDISEEGITKDLEKMAEVGIKKVILMNVSSKMKTNKDRSVSILSPEWNELNRYALREANRLNIGVNIANCPGWTLSGGPWIKPEQSMRRVIWKEFDSSGGTFHQNVRAKGVPGGGSQDIAVLAVPKLKSISVEGERSKMKYIFEHTKPFTARSLSVSSGLKGSLFAVRNGKRELVTKIDITPRSTRTDFLVNEDETVSFSDIKAQRFELDYEPVKKSIYEVKMPAPARVILSSEPKVAQVLYKQMGRLDPTPYPTWNSYIFENTVEPKDANQLISQKEIINLSNQLSSNGVLDCKLPKGDWRIIYFGMITTGKENEPAPASATGLEVDKMSRIHLRHHFDSYIGVLLNQMTAEEKAAFQGVTIDSYHAGSQNWTDEFAAEFEKRNGYNPILFLPVFTSTVINSAKKTDQFLWDLRRTISDMIAENYVGGLRDLAHEHDMTLTVENYGHWGFAGDFTIYGGYSDNISGEFFSKGDLGDTECRGASSTAHIYGKNKVYSEAFTSNLNLADIPYEIKTRSERMFCDGINHLILHACVHQPRDGGMPGNNLEFGTAFHRNIPWFNESQSWIKYLQRIHTMLQWGDPTNDVLVYIGDFAPQMTGPENPVPKGYHYDYVGSDAILRKLDVVNGKWVTYDENNPKRISARWPVMTIPNTLKYIRPHIKKRIDELEKKGGKIIRSVPVSEKQLVALNIKPAFSSESCSIRWIERKLGDENLFFLSNFEKTGAFTVTLRTKGKQPILMNPVTGEIKKIARYEETANGTKIEISVNDIADSFFLLFRKKGTAPSVVKASASPTVLDLFFNDKNELVAATEKAGTYTLTMSNGKTRSFTIIEDPESLKITDWKTESTDNEGFTETRVTEFKLPASFAKDQRMVLDLGKVEIMAQVTINGKTFDTLWMPPFALDVTDALKPGTNKISVRITSTTEGKPKMDKTVKLKKIMKRII